MHTEPVTRSYGVSIFADTYGIERRKPPAQTRVALARQAHPIRLLAVFGVELIDDIHPLDDAPNRRRAARVELLRVVHEVDEELIGA